MEDERLADISSDSDFDLSNNAESLFLNSTNFGNKNLNGNQNSINSFVKVDVNEISSDDEKNLNISNESLWNGEQKKWQQITAADFEEIRELSDTDDEIDAASLTVAETKYWSQSIVPTKFYIRNKNGGYVGTNALKMLQSQFETKVLSFINKTRDAQPKSEPLELTKFHLCSSCCQGTTDDSTSDENSDSSSSADSSSSDCSSNESSYESDFNLESFSKTQSKKNETRKISHKTKRHVENRIPSKQALMAKQAIERKQNHPCCLHPDVCFNEPGQVNDGPYCKCSWSAKQTGVRHNKFAGEKAFSKCAFNESNINILYHYVLKVLPNPNKFTRSPTKIDVDGITYIFDGFSIFFHQPLPEMFSQSPMNQWSSEFTVKFQKENSPESFTVKDLELFHTYIFDNIMEMYDLDRQPNTKEESCPFYHCLPRFVRFLKDSGKEILPMSSVLKYCIDCFVPFVNDLSAINFCEEPNLLSDLAQTKKGQIFINPTKKPMSIRVDLIDKYDLEQGNTDFYPLFTHFGIRPSAYAYNGKPEYQRALKRFIKLRHLLSLKPNINSEDKQKLRDSEEKLKKLRAECKTKRDISICVNSRGFYETGFYPDIVQHGMFLILMCSHARFHWSLRIYEEERIKYKFKNRILLELAVTHPSYRSNYGTNPDHAKNTLNNCGIIQSKVRGGIKVENEKQEGKTHSGRKRGITALMEIMSMQGSKNAVKTSTVNHNERLEFLGDAVVQFITTVHLFFLFPEADEAVFSTYRSALVQNKHLALLAKKIGLYEFMLYAHGLDLCHESDLRHAMANAFEAVMGAVFLDSNINECDRIFSETLYGDNEELLKVWNDLPNHELKINNPFGDRHIINDISCLKPLTELEEKVGIRFKHIRVLAKAFTRRNIDYNYLTLGHNDRLEFLGDTVLQLIITDYLYKHFPNHQEGHLSLLRACLVSNKTQSVICDDLAMQKYLIITKKAERSGKANMQLKVKDKADLVESFLGALYVDRGFQYCKVFCRVCFFPRLKYFILTQRWNDPKSQLQQCCLTLRQPDSGEPDIPEYKTIGVEGPTNTRVYRVAVYFRNKRLAEGIGSSVQSAQMQAAENALIEKADIFPSFDFRNTYLGLRTNSSLTEEKKEKRSVIKNPNPLTKNFKQKKLYKRYLTEEKFSKIYYTKRANDTNYCTSFQSNASFAKKARSESYFVPTVSSLTTSSLSSFPVKKTNEDSNKFIKRTSLTAQVQGKYNNINKKINSNNFSNELINSTSTNYTTGGAQFPSSSNVIQIYQSKNDTSFKSTRPNFNYLRNQKQHYVKQQYQKPYYQKSSYQEQSSFYPSNYKREVTSTSQTFKGYKKNFINFSNSSKVNNELSENLGSQTQKVIRNQNSLNESPIRFF